MKSRTEAVETWKGHRGGKLGGGGVRRKKGKGHEGGEGERNKGKTRQE